MITFKLTKKSFKELKDKKFPYTIIVKLQSLMDREYSCEPKFVNALREQTCMSDQNLSLIVKKAKKTYKFKDYKDKNIEWTGGSCGCVLEDLSGVIYGLYPFWKAGGKQTLDFSALSRIGYYAISLDERGNIVDNDGNSATYPDLDKDNGKAADFINEARDHRTKMDLVINVDKWNEWRQLDHDAFDELTDNIASLIIEKLRNRRLNRWKPYYTFGGQPVPPIWDGITLYVNSLDDRGNSFVAFIKKLQEKLKTDGNNYNLNILLPMDEFVSGFSKFESLKELIPEKKEGGNGYKDNNYVDYFLVFLEEPTTDSKKKLRREIENNFKGYQRKTMLRKIIPVITSTGYNTQQLEDDLIYFDDNFGGVGIWPLPLKTGKGRVRGINEVLKKGKASVSNLCKFICPNRWYIRIFWDVITIILAILCLLFIISCKMRFNFHSNRIRRAIQLGVLLTISVPLFIVLLDCDPSRSFEFSDPMFIVGLIVNVLAAAILFILFWKKEAQP
jgi:hypothetical protein